MASVAAQRHPDVECILVDDGSTDDSAALAQQWIAAQAGPVRFQLLCHERNRGQSAARNTGIRAATGDYVYFLDSDDEIFPDTLARFVECAEANEMDFAVGEYEIEGGTFPRWAIRIDPGVHRGREAILGSYLRSDWQTLVGNRFVRRKFIEDHQLYFAEGLVHEDELWNLMLACKAQSMGVVKGPTYLYRIHENSTMTANPGRRFEAWLEILRRMENFVAAEGLAAQPRVLEYFAIRRTELVERAQRAGLDAYAVYRREVRASRPFDRRVFWTLRAGWKLRYVHALLPPSLGYAYLRYALRTVPRLARLRRAVACRKM